MSDPFIIWTMRRTGGTTFAGLMTELSEHPGTQHEPFNIDRKFGHVVQTWNDTQDVERLMADLDMVLKDRPLIKHCYELIPEMVNLALIRATTRKGYRHIVLDRGSEVDRIISLELAKVTGAWGADSAAAIYAEIEDGTKTLDPIDIDAARKHLITCANLRQWLAGVFDLSKHTPLLVYFEELYTSFEDGKRVVEEILSCLDINPGDHADYEAKLIEALTESSQKSQSIAHAVPNMDELRDALSDAYDKQGFKFENAHRNWAAKLAVETGAPVDLPASSGLIVDVGCGTGEDSAFYLAKGFKVVSIPHNADEGETLKIRLSGEIEAGNLIIQNENLPGPAPSHPVLDDICEVHGVPHYAKVEGNNCEAAVVLGLTGTYGLPLNLSFQATPQWERILDHLVSLGYTQFQMVRQGANFLPPTPTPAREGLHVPIRFTGSMSGCFGNELPPEDWHSMPDFLTHVRVIQAKREEARALGQKPGWYDIHARLPAQSDG